jgi:hypothetical protein
MTRPWTELRFRSSPALELKRIHELPREQQTALAELQRDDDFYGVLVPRVPASAGIKSVGRAAAALMLSLAEPSTLDPAQLANEAWRNDVIDLVLDGILEIEHEGRFVYGADAFALLLPVPFEERQDEERGKRKEERGGASFLLPPSSFLLSLSSTALRHAEALATSDAAVLTTALYTYNRLPRTRAWAARFPDRDAVLAHLGESALLDRHWIRGSDTNGWISWRSRAPRAFERTSVTWKLYVSPRPEQIREAFHALVHVLAGIDGAQMKIGSDAAGLLRPDKLVAYFHSQEELNLAARELAVALRGCPAHGVPFTAMFDDDGLLSWGADPPDSERALSWLERESWRLFVARTLAAAMVIALHASTPAIAPWQFAVERARRHGIDVDTWAPSPALWSGPA